MSRTARIDLAYDGSAFHGWQFQPKLRSVQGDLSREISRLFAREVKATGAGRTDTGVHALAQVAHVHCNSLEEIERLQRALGRAVPDDIDIISVREVSPDFEARFSAIWRRYEYRLRFGYDIFTRKLECQIYRALDRDAIDEALHVVRGRHDFSSFCKTSSLKDDNHCDVLDCRFDWREESGIFHIRSNRFLHHMVRILVGTLIEVGEGHRAPAEMTEIMAARDRSAAGKMAPACGLYLAEVGYPEDVLDPQYRLEKPPAEETK
jgi:tRNA pseudouridine38-40 synthase